MQIAALIQARLTSTRLPGKVLASIGGFEALYHTVARVRQVISPRWVWVVMPNTRANAPLAQWCKHHAIPYLCGAEHDVLSRYHAAAERLEPDAIIRITGDCPFIDPDEIDRVLDVFQTHKLAYASNIAVRTLPRGLDVEVFSRQALAQANRHATDPYDREHVTPWMQRTYRGFRHEERGADFSMYRWCLDTPDDLAWFRLIADEFEPCVPPIPTTDDLLAFLARKPWYARMEQPTT